MSISSSIESSGEVLGTVLGNGRVLIAIAIFVAVFAAHAIYVVATRFTRTITVRRLYTGVEMESAGYSSGGSYAETTYMVADTQGRVYQVSNSLWLWAWDKEQLWSSMQEGRTYVVRGYGTYHSALGVYAHIVGAEPA